LTHLARNADALRHMIEGAAAGEVWPMYPSAEARDAAIDAGALRSLAEIVVDIRKANWSLESAWAGLNADGWAGSGMTRMGEARVTSFPLRRWREVTVHRVDLGLGYEPDDWPVTYVETDFAVRSSERSEALPDDVAAGSRARQLAWLLGRQSGFASPAPAF
jgi:maleylpyruvate isomerase